MGEPRKISRTFKIINDTVMEYIKLNQNHKTVVWAGSLEYLMEKVFYHKIQNLKYHPRNIKELVRCLNQKAGHFELYSETAADLCQKHNWQIIIES